MSMYLSVPVVRARASISCTKASHRVHLSVCEIDFERCRYLFLERSLAPESALLVVHVSNLFKHVAHIQLCIHVAHGCIHAAHAQHEFLLLGVMMAMCVGVSCCWTRACHVAGLELFVS